MRIDELLTVATERGASDLHLKVGSVPTLRVNGALVPALDRPLTADDTESLAGGVLSAGQRERLRETGEVDFAYSVPGLGRFRLNVFRQRGTIGLVLRVLPHLTRSMEQLGLPPVMDRICMEERGLVLVTGTTGSGKTTTLAAMVDYINRTRSAHIVTIEEPIEYLHRDIKSIVTQREVNVDTPSFAAALRGAMRQDPDVILLGEMRDLETIETAMHAAETGHLVLSTLQGMDATETIHRVVAVFPPHHQYQVRLQLAGLLKAIISQRIIPRADGSGRCLAAEVLVTTPYIRDCIMDKEKAGLIPSAIAAGTSQYGMQTFDQAIFRLHQTGQVTYEEALRWVSNVDEFKLRMQGISSVGDLAREEMAQRGSGGDTPDILRFSR